MTPFGGPYCMMGRSLLGGGGGGGFGSLTPYMVASKTCGSTVMVTCPSLVMLSFGGLLGSSITTPFRFVGLDQYFSNIPSVVHFCRDRARDSASTPLRRRQLLVIVQWRPGRQQTHLSVTLWYSLSERSSGWGELTVGSGLPAATDLGRGGGASSAGAGSGSGADAGVADRCGGVVFRLLAACPARAAARAGSFLFFSIATAS